MNVRRKLKQRRTILLKWSPKKKFRVLFGLVGAYAIFVVLLELFASPVWNALESLSAYWNQETTKTQTPPTISRSKLIEEKPPPLPLMIDKTKFPAKLDHRLLFEEVEHGASYCEQASFLNIFHQIGTMTQEEIVKAFEIQRQEERITAAHLFYVPERIVGRFVHFSGSLIRLREISMQKNDWGITRMWEGQFMDREYNVISFRVLDEPVNLHAHCDRVAITGIFFKLLATEVDQQTLKLTPLIIGRKLVPLK